MNKMVCKISSMRRNFLGIRFVQAALLLFLATSSLAIGDDHFAVAVGPRDTLMILGPNGATAASLSVPTIAKPVKVGDTTFQVSYGRDANDLLTVILTPDPTEPQSLHFNVLSKNVDTDKQAVVTLTFSNSLNHVSIDPGYIGVVQVDSETLRRHLLTDESYPAPPASSEAPLTASTSPELAPRPSQANQAMPPLPVHQAMHQTAVASSGGLEPASSPVPPIYHSTPAIQSAQTQPSPAPMLRTSSVTTESVPPPSSMPSSSTSSTSTSLSRSEANSTGGANPSMDTDTANYQPPTKPPGIPLEVPASTSSQVNRLFWAEPVTPPGGSPPPVGLNEMKLIDVYGPVTVKTPDGAIKSGANGMTVPSGSTILTSDGGSAAVFIGGVNSARLLPNTNISVTQNLSGNVRHTNIDLRDGTVFSRVGRRPGEKEDYRVSTPEGVAAARGTEFANHRSNGHHYVYVVQGIVEMIVNGKTFKIIAGDGTVVGMGSIPPTQDEKTVLMGILNMLQQFNVDLNAILAKINGGTPLSDAEMKYFNAQLSQSIYLVNELGQLISGPTGVPLPYNYYTNEELRGIIPAVRRAINQEIQPFHIPPVTPF
jgi:mannose-6-phosphate isomerase-like protein (cupin superfamily)